MNPTVINNLNGIYSFLAYKFDIIHPNLAYKRIIENDSRNGKVREFIDPVTFTVRDNSKYFLTVPGRVINLPFALAELIWIMSGDHKGWIGDFNKQVLNYADEINGEKIFNAAYGYRMRQQFNIDQLKDMIIGIGQDVNSRQNVMVYRHPVKDRANKTTNDRACNIASLFQVRDGKVNMSQVVRSNDFIWGMPYNFIQFGHIQQTIAEALSLDVGSLTWFANNLHVYEKHFDELHDIHNHESFYPYKIKVPELGRGGIDAYLYRLDHYMYEGWIKVMQEYSDKSDFTEKDIRNLVGDSPFWYNGLIVLLSYMRRHDVDWCLQTLEAVESNLFRLMALRYYYNYYKRFREKIELSNAEKELVFIRS